MRLCADGNRPTRATGRGAGTGRGREGCEQERAISPSSWPYPALLPAASSACPGRRRGTPSPGAAPGGRRTLLWFPVGLWVTGGRPRDGCPEVTRCPSLLFVSGRQQHPGGRSLPAARCLRAPGAREGALRALRAGPLRAGPGGARGSGAGRGAEPARHRPVAWQRWVGSVRRAGGGVLSGLGSKLPGLSLELGWSTWVKVGRVFGWVSCLRFSLSHPRGIGAFSFFFFSPFLLLIFIYVFIYLVLIFGELFYQQVSGSSPVLEFFPVHPPRKENASRKKLHMRSHLISAVTKKTYSPNELWNVVFCCVGGGGWALDGGFSSVIMSPWLLSSGDHICGKMEEAQRREQQEEPGGKAESPLGQPCLLNILTEY